MQILFWAYIVLGIIVGTIVGFFIGRWIGSKLKNQEIESHRMDARTRSRAVLGGQFSENLAPFLPEFKYNPNECRFVGKPIDFIVFKGLDEKKIDEVIFLEVKSGKSQLSSVERSLKKAIHDKKVSFEEYRIDEAITRLPDDNSF